MRTSLFKILGELNGHTEEMITGYKTVVAYNKEGKVASALDPSLDLFLYEKV